jgi:predicted anti-sigma-YlaC factor YlaD
MSDLHVSRDDLIAWRDAGAGDRTRIVAHLATCEACRAIAADVERNRPVDELIGRFDAKDFVAAGYRTGATARARWPARRWMWPAAAAALIVLALVPAWLARFREPDTLRGGATTLEPVRPANDASISADELTFEWRGASAADRVRLNVVDLDRPDQPLIEREVTGPRYAPTAEERRRFRSGQSVHWYIEPRSGGGGPSATARFRVR